VANSKCKLVTFIYLKKVGKLKIPFLFCTSSLKETYPERQREMAQ
jgi:hypothetical protein